MDAKDKAMELFNSFEADLMEADVYYLDFAKKRCALIACDEILDIFDNIDDIQAWYYLYWQEVKEEINKL